MRQAPDTLGAYLPALTPNHFVSGLCARVTQNKFFGYFKIRRRTDSHAAVGLIYHEAVVRCCAGFGGDSSDVPKAPPHRAPSIIKSMPDHGVTNRLVKHPHAPLSKKTAVGLLPPIAGALTQEVIDIAVILNALRALTTGHKFTHRKMPAASATVLRQDHERMETTLDRLREIADELDIAEGARAVTLISEADDIVGRRIVEHERDDERAVYPRVSKYLGDHHGLGTMSRAHREIIHMARLLRRLATGLSPHEIDHYLIRDAQRVIEGIEALVRIHNAQEEDIYEHAAGA
jgi:hypothetical protein